MSRRSYTQRAPRARGWAGFTIQNQGSGFLKDDRPQTLNGGNGFELAEPRKEEGSCGQTKEQVQRARRDVRARDRR